MMMEKLHGRIGLVTIFPDSLLPYLSFVFLVHPTTLLLAGVDDEISLVTISATQKLDILFPPLLCPLFRR
jgi:hypothetical protein